MTLLSYGTQVKVVKLIDETGDTNLIGSIGKVIDHTEDEKFHVIEFDLNTVPADHPKYDKEAYRVDNFYFDELEIV